MMLGLGKANKKQLYTIIGLAVLAFIAFVLIIIAILPAGEQDYGTDFDAFEQGFEGCKQAKVIVTNNTGLTSEVSVRESATGRQCVLEVKIISSTNPELRFLEGKDLKCTIPVSALEGKDLEQAAEGVDLEDCSGSLMDSVESVS